MDEYCMKLMNWSNPRMRLTTAVAATTTTWCDVTTATSDVTETTFPAQTTSSPDAQQLLLLQQLIQNFTYYSSSSSNSTNDTSLTTSKTTTTTTAAFVSPPEGDLISVVSTGFSAIENVTEMVQNYLTRYADHFSQFLEYKILNTIAMIGLIFNLITIFLARFDKETPKNCKFVFRCYLLFEEIFLIFILAFVAMRKSWIYEGNMEPMTHFTCFLELILLIQPWFFNQIIILLTNSLSEMSLDRKVAKCDVDLSNLVKKLLTVSFVATLFVILFTPTVRMFINESISNHFICDVPLENYWDLYDLSDNKKIINIYIHLFYVFSFTAFNYLIPLVVLSKNNCKLIDLVRKIHIDNKSDLSENEDNFIYFAIMISSTCNFYTSSITFKLVPILLYDIEFLVTFIGKASQLIFTTSKFILTKSIFPYIYSKEH
ncbi:hypothetical protein HELRODRAFT_175465 [Helobdella robusta]|uniref:Uncharacterized protein n=1 Tax=Helobdella robusta TaxID=6412 RepID=T1F9A3_HELRO|nr:hypothetical protein HELRODRAFT_175465 [Helobdella robusta]ESO00962.1 hypothetical protein HELRODRAFT_175465 [Helobdella robusta]